MGQYNVTNEEAIGRIDKSALAESPEPAIAEGSKPPGGPSMTKFVSDFALVDVKQGRARLAKLCETSHRIPVTITGYINAGAGGIGYDDGTSCEFAMTVERAQFGTPVYVACDKNGRPWARLSDLKPGDRIELDGGFTCIPMNRTGCRTVKEAETFDQGLYFNCEHGRHYLGGQVDYEKCKGTDALVGVYKLRK